MKKILSMALAVMLLVLPLAALAETDPLSMAQGRRMETTITLHDLNTALLTMVGTPENAISMINDLIEAVSMTAYAQEDEVGLSLNLQGADGRMPSASVLNLKVGVDGNTLMVGSNLLGEAPVRMDDLDDMKQIIIRLMHAFQEQLDLDDDDVAQIEAILNYYMDEKNLAAMAEQIMTQLSSLSEVALDTSALTELITGYRAYTAITSEFTQPGNCDPAATLYTLNLPKDEANKLLPAVVQFIQDNPMLENTIAEMIFESRLTWNMEKQQILEGKAELFAGNLCMSIYESETEDIVKQELTGVLGNNVPFALIMAKKGDTMTFSIVPDRENRIQIVTTEHYTATTASTSCKATVTITKDGVSIPFHVAVTTDASFDGLDATSHTEIGVGLTNVDVLKASIVTRTMAPQATMDVQEAIDLADVSEAEFLFWCQQVPANVTSALIGGMLLLPPSVLTQLMNAMY